jgi:hypothetical protein
VQGISGLVRENREYILGSALIVLSLILSYSILYAPFEYILHPHFGEIAYTVSIYGWPDLRISFLEVLLILVIVLTAFTTANRRLFKFAIYCSMIFSAFNFILPVVIDYGLNLSGKSPLPGFWTRAASDSFLAMIFLRLTVNLPMEALIWLASMTMIFGLSRVDRGAKTAISDGLWFAFAVLSAFAIGDYVIDPSWFFTYVTLLQVGTAIQWFSNEDLLVSSVLGFALLSAAKVLRKRSRRELAAPEPMNQ